MKFLYSQIIPCFILSMVSFSALSQNDTIYGMNFTAGNMQFSSIDLNSNNVTLYGNGPVTADQFQGGVYDFDPIQKRYFYPRGVGSSIQLITIDANSGAILYNPLLSNSTPSVIPITNIAYNWLNDTLYGTHHANENGQTVLRFSFVDITSGNVTIVNNTPISYTPYIAGSSDIDPINRRYFMVSGTQVKTVDIGTGQLLSDVAIQYPGNPGAENLLNISYNWADGNIYGLYMYADTSSTNGSSLLKLASLDPSTGQMSVLSASPLSQDGIVSGDCDIDVVGERYFYIRQGKLYLVDITNGNLISSNTIQNPNNAVAPIINLAYDDLKLPQLSPAALVLQDTTYIAPGQTATLNAYVAQGADYSWSDGSTNSQISVNQEGNYFVTVMADGFEIYGQTYVKEQEALSIEETKVDLDVFPNPATEELTIRLNEGILLGCELYDMQGRFIQTFDTNKEVHSVDHLVSGVYTLVLRTQQGRVTEQLVIK